MKKLIIIFLCLVPAVCFAQKNENECGFSIECNIPTQIFSIIVRSPSNDCTNDDQEVYFKVNGKESKIEIPNAWYYDIDNVGNKPALCKSGYPEYPLFPINGKQVLIILRLNNRPNFDKIAAAVIDVTTANVLDYQILGESQKFSTGILVKDDKFKVQLIKKYLEEMRCDCDASIVEGWLEFNVINGKIQKHWL